MTSRDGLRLFSSAADIATHSTWKEGGGDGRGGSRRGETGGVVQKPSTP